MSIGLTFRKTIRRAALLDTGEGPNCIRFDAMPKEAEEKIKLDVEGQILEANGRPLDIVGQVMLFAHVGDCRIKAEILLCLSVLAPIFGRIRVFQTASISNNAHGRPTSNEERKRGAHTGISHKRRYCKG